MQSVDEYISLTCCSHVRACFARCELIGFHVWVSLCIPKTLWSPYLENQWREFQPILATDVFVFIDLLIRFWDHKVKSQGHSKQWPGWRQYLCNYGSQFHQT